MIASLVFYFLGTVLTISALLVITARNPVHSVLFLILGFFTVAGLFVLIGAEYIAFTLAIVYVGAVAVLFLFVVMMLDVSFQDLRKGAMQYVPIGVLIGGVLLIELMLVYIGWSSSSMAQENRTVPYDMSGENTDVTNAHAIGAVLYTRYFLIFQICGLILLVAMIGAIVLTLRSRPGVKRQSVYSQVNRKREDVIEVRKITSRTGV